MKYLIITALVLFIGHTGKAQIEDPVKWTFTAKKINANSYEVRLMAVIENGWHIYSQSTPDGGPVPTLVSFTKNPLLTLSGTVKEIGKLEQRHEEIFGVDVKQYSHKVEFVQVVNSKGKVKTSITGSVEFMVCNDTQCLPPSTKKFSLAIN